jgi:nucleotide-binding universal stress UspA family protein
MAREVSSSTAPAVVSRTPSRLRLGSVSEHCVTHCHCPVVVIRGTGRRAEQ